MNNYVDVVIIGGGFAGVTAARELTQAGRSVVLLEARSRLGGRTWTRESPLGRTLEIGGTWVHWIQPHVWAEIVRYDLGIVPSPVPERALWLTDGQVKEGTPDELIDLLDPGMRAVLDPAMRHFPNPHQPDLDVPELKEADTLSFREKLDSLDVSAEQRDVLDGMWALNFNGHPENSAWTQGLRWAALSGGSWQLMFEACATYKLAGGTRALLDAVASDAGAADIRLDTAVRRVVHDAAGVSVTTESGEVVSAKQAIITLPLNALRSVEFEPALSPVKAKAAAEGQASTGCKFWARIQGELAPFVAMATSKEPMTFAQLEYHVDGDSLVVGFGPDADGLDVTDRAAVESGLRQWLPDVRVVAVDGHDWVHDPYSQETWPMLRPGQLTEAMSELRAPESRVRLAGSDYAEGWAGFIDGAIESAKRSARRVLADLGEK
ncbi:flavin monoamine oxidase family protein [Nocardioides sp. YIM B13467]|uniref:flavin monoamine oxidase family protein n=1 Tax=Nocardioides sp. YIM B13467 TaxID=3366294 RepID=UPI00366AB441